jgi:Protein of unknown function (DUF3107)
VEVKVGVKGAPRELVIESSLTPDQLAAAVQKALADEGGILVLADDKGKQLIVPSDKLAYVEIGESNERRVGFGAM